MSIVHYTCGFISGLFFLAVSFSLFSGENTDGFLSMILQVLLAAIGTGVGAFLAFRLQRDAVKNDEYKTEAAQGNRLLLAIGDNINQLMEYQRVAVVKEMSGFHNYVRYRPVIELPLNSNLNKMPIPEKLIARDPAICIYVKVLMSHYDICIALIKRHNTNHEKILQEMMSKMEIGLEVRDGVSVDELDKALISESAKNYVELRDVANHLDEKVTNGITESIEHFKLIRQLLNEEYSKASFVDFDFESLQEYMER